jgi:hypothetical protein
MGALMPAGVILEKAPPLADFYEPFIRKVIASCRRVAGLDLIQQENLQRDCLGKSVFYGKFALLTHRGGADAILNYGNDYVLKLWDTTWAEFITMPSKLTAPEEGRETREEFMETVRHNGFATGYDGIRISRTGRRFVIKDVTVWQLVDGDGLNFGVGAYFSNYERIVV